MSRKRFPTSLVIALFAGTSVLSVACSAPSREVATVTPTETAPPSARDRVTGTAGPRTVGPDGVAPRTVAPDDAAVTSRAVCAEGALIEGAVWIEVDGRPSLEVTPTALLRRCALVGVGQDAWSELVVLAPDADRPGMAAQLTCHVVFAPGKDVWHLEPWRPVVDDAEMITTRCNPGGPDPD